ncbi:hypothetical protein SLS57_004121 [Botryosphaeria dothidea]
MRFTTLLTTSIPMTMAAAAAVLPRSAPPALSTSTAFKLIANVLSPNDPLAINGYELNRFVMNSDTCTNVLALSPPAEGSRFHATAAPSVWAPVTYNSDPASAYLTLPRGEGSSTVPAALPVEVNCGAGGTTGVAIAPNADGVPVLTYGTGSGGWMACPAATLGTQVGGDDGAVLVAIRRGGQRLLDGCEEVEFKAVCYGEKEQEGGEVVECVVA